MEEHLSPLAITHLLQHTLRSLCVHENSHWVYAVFWRILPRNYPPPKWDGQAAYDRSRGNRRNWILVWEDGFCNFAASTGDSTTEFQPFQGLQPELFFKMSHEIYNYGEGLIGKVAADHTHKWIHKEPNDQEINFLSAWNNSTDCHPRTWEAQFQSGIKTIALIAVREGVVQLGAVQKVVEDLNYVVLLRKKLSYIESIPGVLLPHPSSSSFPFTHPNYGSPDWPFHQTLAPCPLPPPPPEFYDHFNQSPLKEITPSMSSLEALLSKLPSVLPPPPPPSSSGYYESSQQYISPPRLMEKVAKEEIEEKSRSGSEIGGNGTSMADYRRGSQKYEDYQDLNVSSSRSYNGF